MSAKKRRPEFELGPLFINQMQDYLGIRVVNKLSSEQAANMARLCNECASTIGRVLEESDLVDVDADDDPPGR